MMSPYLPIIGSAYLVVVCYCARGDSPGKLGRKKKKKITEWLQGIKTIFFQGHMGKASVVSR